MQMRINLDSIFGETNSKNQQTNNQPSCNTSIHTEIYEQQKSLDFHYKLRNSLFIDDDIESETLSHNEKSIKTTSKKNKNIQSNNDESLFQSSQFSGGYSIPENTVPGERLYYESKNNMLRKRQQIQRVKQQRIAKQEYQNTFKPQINKRSQKLAKKAKVTTNYKTNTTKKAKNESYQTVEPEKMPSYIKKQMDEVKKCTFKPKLIAKSTTTLHRTKDQVFDGLFQQHKLKSIKQKLKTEEEEGCITPKVKKLSKKQLQSFIDRNNQFINKVHKKNQLLLKTSKQYDLDTGHKLFTPSTKSTKPHQRYFTTQSAASQHKLHSQTMTKNKSYQEQIQKDKYNSSLKPLFGKHTETDEYQQQSNEVNIKSLMKQMYDSKHTQEEYAINPPPNQSIDEVPQHQEQQSIEFEPQNSYQHQQISQIQQLHNEDVDQTHDNYFQKHKTENVQIVGDEQQINNTQQMQIKGSEVNRQIQ